MTPRDLPQIQALANQSALRTVARRFSDGEVVAALRVIIDGLRAGLVLGTIDEFPDFEAESFAETVAQQIAADRAPTLKPVINASGILIHTNLGRAPLAPAAIRAVQKVAAHPSNLELDLQTGKRGSRHDHVEALICALTGAEAAVVVNNCAAAVMLSLMSTATGRNVIASRGELIEIGGSFRLPDVIAQSGAMLREVGATNKTRTSDYAGAIDADTAVLLKSHTSNFKIVGFTSAPDRRDLAALAKDHDVILMEDLGSGVLIDLAPYGLTDEPVVGDVLKAGVDLVMFSGDKLLGGPQAGIIAGRRDIVAGLKAHPLMRAVRIDKLSLAALEATLRLYQAPYDPVTEIPVLQMLSEPVETVKLRAQRLMDALKESGLGDVEICEAAAFVGAGTLPEQDLKSAAVSVGLPHLTAQHLMSALRAVETPIIGRIERDRVLLDMRTTCDADLPVIVAALAALSKV
jgi:L-seryl-tRNA(Ser) seleniumtransferase